MWVGNDQKGENGYIASNRLRPLSSVSRSASTIKYFWKRNPRHVDGMSSCDCLFTIEVYCQPQNRMLESLVLFESVVNSRWFLSTSIILFLNKIDIFQKKIPRSPLEKYYPEYQGGPDIEKATKFILWKFVNKNRAKLALYPQ